MRVVGSLSLILIFLCAAIFVVDGQAEPPPQATSIPTLPSPTLALLETLIPTPEPFPTEVASIYDELVTKVGFQHPELMMAAEMFAQSNRSEMVPESGVSKSTFSNVQYTFVEFPALTGSGLLLFANEDGNITLVMKYEMFIRSLMGIADRNGNGLPDFGYYIQDVGNCCPGRLFTFDIDQDQNAIDITPSRDAQEWIDIDNDGIFEIKGVTWIKTIIIRSPHEAVFLTRIHGWNGTAYVDISAEKASFYDAEITTLRRQLLHMGCAVYWSSTIHQILLDYYAMGRLQEGWKELRPILNASRCLKDRTASMLLNTFQQMVDNNQPWQ
jgi:hypothetical protein